MKMSSPLPIPNLLLAGAAVVLLLIPSPIQAAITPLGVTLIDGNSTDETGLINTGTLDLAINLGGSNGTTINGIVFIGFPSVASTPIVDTSATLTPDSTTGAGSAFRNLSPFPLFSNPASPFMTLMNDLTDSQAVGAGNALNYTISGLDPGRVYTVQLISGDDRNLTGSGISNNEQTFSLGSGPGTVSQTAAYGGAVLTVDGAIASFEVSGETSVPMSVFVPAGSPSENDVPATVQGVVVTSVPGTAGLSAPSSVVGTTNGSALILSVPVGNSAGVTYNITGLSYGGPAGSDFGDSIVTPFPIGAGGNENLTIDFSPSSGGLAEATLTLATDDPSNPSIELDFSIEVHDPEIAIDSSLEFGEFLTLPGPTSLTVTAENIGDTAGLNLSAPVITGPGAGAFSVSSLPGSIAAGTSDVVGITFDPAGSGTFTAQLSLTTDAPFSPTVTVDLTGTVIPSGGVILSPIEMVVSSAYDAGHGGDALTDLTDLNASNQHLGGGFGSNVSWISGDNNTSDEWVYLDLGAEFNLEEVRIWNYHEVVGAAFETNGRSVKGYELFVAGTGAVLPVGPSESPFTGGGGWITANGPGDLNIGPTTVNAGVSLLAATDSLAVPHTGVRYIGIDIASRHGPDPFTTTAVGLAQIQVIEGSASFAITSVIHNPATGEVVITFDSEPGEFYFIDASDSLESWQELSDFNSQGTSTTVCVIPPEGISSCPLEFTFTAPLAQSRFFRIRR